METIKQVLMRRDNMTSDEADEAIAEARDDLRYMLDNGDMMGAEEVCLNHFGLEADYLMELL